MRYLGLFAVHTCFVCVFERLWRNSDAFLVAGERNVHRFSQSLNSRREFVAGNNFNCGQLFFIFILPFARERVVGAYAFACVLVTRRRSSSVFVELSTRTETRHATHIELFRNGALVRSTEIYGCVCVV